MVLQMSRPSKITNSDIYYFRKRVPADLVGIVGRREIRISLGTKDPTLAKELFRKKEQEIENEWKALRAKPESLTHRQIVALSGVLYQEYIELLRDEAGEPELWHHVLRIADSAYATGQLEQWYGSLVDELLKKQGIAIDQYSRKRLLDAAHSAHRQASEQLLKQSEGDYSPDPKADRFPPMENKQPSETKAPQPILTLTNLFERWRSDHLADKKSPRTVVDYGQKLNALLNYLGHDNAHAVTAKDIGGWVEYLRHTKQLSAKTVASKYLVVVKRIYNAVKKKGEDIDNPAEVISVSVPKRRKERPSGFTDAEAKVILSAASQIDNINSRRPQLNKLTIRWVPWICAYTGARCGEIVQLRTNDLVEEYGVLCLRITPEAGTVKTGQYRLVPVHQHLIEMGLPQLIRSRPHGHIFIETTANTSDEQLIRRAGSAVKMIGKWVREDVKIADPRIQPNHAWRHRFKTIARDVDIETEYMNALQGHDDGRSATNYGEHTVKALYREMQKVPHIDIA